MRHKIFIKIYTKGGDLTVWLNAAKQNSHMYEKKRKILQKIASFHT